MKRFSIFKVVQLGVIVVYAIFIMKFILHMNGLNSFETGWITTERAYMVMLITTAIALVFVLVDLRFLQKLHIEQQGIDKATYLDPVTGGLNRFSCDMMLKNYDTDEIRPQLGCFNFTLTNLMEINEKSGYDEGNILIKNFSDILSRVTGGKGIVARNAPNNFLVVLKKCGEAEADAYLKDVENAICAAAKNFGPPIRYQYGMALNCQEEKTNISQLIALAQRRISE